MPNLQPRSGDLTLARRFQRRGAGKMSSASRQRRLNSTVADATECGWPSFPWVENPRLNSTAATRQKKQPHFSSLPTQDQWLSPYSLRSDNIRYMEMQAVKRAETEDGSKVIEDVIWIPPERVSGAPCFINTRVPIQNLFDYLEGGEPLDKFLEGFPPITREQAVKVLELARTALFNSILNGEDTARS